VSDVSVTQEMETVDLSANADALALTVLPNATTVVVEETDLVVSVVTNELSVQVLDPSTQVVVEVPTIEVVSVGQQGPSGPLGPVGPRGVPGGGVYTFEQNIPSAVWVIVHGFGTILPVTVLDSSGQTVEGDVEYPDENTAIVTFSAPFAGIAYVG
jgi:hypothetical protein